METIILILIFSFLFYYLGYCNGSSKYLKNHENDINKIYNILDIKDSKKIK